MLRFVTMPVDFAPLSGYVRAVPSDPPAQGNAAPAARPPRILVFDSGLGGLTVFAAVTALCGEAEFTYAADDAGFPYGAWRSGDLVRRVVDVIGDLLRDARFDVVVIACNTASTLVLPDLRAAFPDVPFVGTVPAIKPAATLSRSKLISVLATPGTVARDYTRGLIDSFAGDCRVMLVGSRQLATLAEAAMVGSPVADTAIADEIAPCFVEADHRRTDAIVLACTHYPLLLARFERLAPWPVAWIDPAPAIARRVVSVLGEHRCTAETSSDRPFGRAIFTSGQGPTPALAALLARYRLKAQPDAIAPVAYSIVSSG